MNTYDCTKPGVDFVYGEHGSMMDSISDWYATMRLIRERNDLPANEVAFVAMRFAEVEALQESVKQFGIAVWDGGLCKIDDESKTRGMKSNAFTLDGLLIGGKKKSGKCDILSYSIAGRTMITITVMDGEAQLLQVSLVCESGGKGERSGSQSLYGTARNAIYTLGFVARKWTAGEITMSEDTKVGIAGL